MWRESGWFGVAGARSGSSEGHPPAGAGMGLSLQV
jgi:hypothetical protein